MGDIAHWWGGESSDLPSLLINKGGTAGFERKTVRECLPERPFRGERWNFGDLYAAFLDVDNDTRLDLLIGSGDYPDGQFLRLQSKHRRIRRQWRVHRLRNSYRGDPLHCPAAVPPGLTSVDRDLPYIDRRQDERFHR